VAFRCIRLILGSPDENCWLFQVAGAWRSLTMPASAATKSAPLAPSAMALTGLATLTTKLLSDGANVDSADSDITLRECQENGSGAETVVSAGLMRAGFVGVGGRSWHGRTFAVSGI
jgi:hypothetical protein